MGNIIEKLSKDTTPLISSVNRDEFIKASETAFDCTFNGTSEFYPWAMPKNLPSNFNIGVIFGASGSGKSTLLRLFGAESTPIWDPNKAIVSHFDSPADA